MATTFTKRIRLTEAHATSEIANDTKARRAWLAAKVAEIKAQPHRDAVIVGKGSYEHVVVYELRETAGRARERGICQFCGNAQVVVDGVLVLHGYRRPGDGYTIGRCPCAGYAPLNVDKTETEKFFAQYTTELNAALISHEAATFAEQAALHARAGKEATAYSTRPSQPRVRYEQNPTDGEKTALAVYEVAVAAWQKAYPLTTARERAAKRVLDTSRTLADARMWHKHFETLLTSGVHGSSLKREIVA